MSANQSTSQSAETKCGPRKPRTITANGRTQTIADWAKELGWNKLTIYARLSAGMSEEDAIATPIGSHLHGMTKTPEYIARTGMLRRCNYEKDASYKRYGGRGIFVCQRWTDSFEAFLEDMGPRPSKEHSLDRIDNNSGYACGKCDDCHARGITKCNCRWATLNTQARNRNWTRRLEFNGETLPLQDWAERLGIAPETIWRRLMKYKWPIEKALTVQVDPDREPQKPRYATLNGQTKRISEWATELGLRYGTIIRRIDEYGWDVERALTTPIKGRAK